MTDFTIYQGADATPYYVVLNEDNCPVDVSGISAATWIAAEIVNQTITPVITKHFNDIDTPITVAEDPDESISTLLHTAASSGGYSIVVESGVGFAAPNTVKLDDLTHSETRTVASVVGTTITFTAPLTYDYIIPNSTRVINTTQNCVFVHLSPDDTEVMGDVGTFRHELRITLNSLQYVVYPTVGSTATFDVVQSLTWDAEGKVPRISRETTIPYVSVPEKELPKEDPYLNKKTARQLRDEARRNKSV
jgi:hypothetical protein